MKKYKSIHEIRYNADLKFFKFLPSPPLRVRVTLFFLLFGIIVGYLSFMIFTTISTRSYISLASNVFMDYFQSCPGHTQNDILFNVFSDEYGKDDNLSLNKKLMYHISSNFHQISDINLYYFDTEDNCWKYLKRFYPDSLNNEKKYEPLPEKLKKKLSNSLKRKITSSSSLFFGKQNTITANINLTRENDKYSYVLSITADKEGLFSFLKNNIFHLSIFSMIIFLVSIIIGNIFSSYIVKPVKSLAEEAAEFASGNLNHRFNLKRGDEIGILADSLNTMAEKIEQFIKKIERDVDTIETMNKIDKAVLSSVSRHDLLERVINIAASLYEGCKIMIAIRNENKEGFDLLAFDNPHINKILGDKPFVSDIELGPKLLSETRSLNQNVYYEFYNDLPEPFNALVDIGSVINVPIYISEKYLGSLIMTRDVQAVFSGEDIGVISSLADQVGVALQSVSAFEEKENLLLGILMALTRSIDAKSKWTAGHSERVAKIAEAIGIKMKLSENELRNLAISALLHDIGKISVPETILDKPGKLTDDEYNLIKKHPQIGAEIIEEIPGYDNIVPGILYHHEHWDGRGYPFGLKGKQIPLISRIMTVADVYDAITDDRPYRKGLDVEDAHKFIEENKGKLFDPEIADIFIEILCHKKQPALLNNSDGI